MRKREWYSEDLFQVIKRIPNAKTLKVIGSLQTSGYLTVQALGIKYKVRMFEGRWSPCLTKECRGDVSKFLAGRLNNAA